MCIKILYLHYIYYESMSSNKRSNLPYASADLIFFVQWDKIASHFGGIYLNDMLTKSDHNIY